MTPVQLTKELIGLACRVTGAFALFRRLFLRNRAIILVYHSPTPAAFERHLAFLSRLFTFISIDDLSDALAHGDFSGLPPFPLVVTLDDGHASNYRLLDVFKTYGAKPLIYCCSGIVATNRRFWWKCGFGDVEFLKTLPTDKMLALLKKETGYEPEREYATRDALSAAEIGEMLPSVTIGSHTRFHPILPRCDDARCEEELTGSRADLERLTGGPVRHLAWPNGDNGVRERRLGASAGYATIRTIRYGWVTPRSDPLDLRAVEVQHDASLGVLRAEILGINAFLKRFFGKLYRA
jgi:peptidoglycan/xylan/chitin deacetylase (PgdA/CDA1 family)